MGVANLFPGLNWLFLRNEETELTDFLPAGKNPHKLKADLKFLGGPDQK